MRHCITLTGGKADRFEQTLDDLEDELGYRPSKPEAVGLLMAAYDDAGSVPLLTNEI